LWTSGAPILKKDDAGKVVSDSIFWCSSNETTQKSVDIPPDFKEESCLAFEKATGGFEVKNCLQKLPFFCEVCNKAWFCTALNIFILIFKDNCNEVSCPTRSDCLKRVFLTLKQYFKIRT